MRQRARIAVVVVVRLCRQAEWTGQGDFHAAVRVGAQKLQIAHFHRTATPDRTDHAGHDRATPGGAEEVGGVLRIQPIQRGGEPIGVALAAHLAVGDDVDASALQVADREQRGVVLRLAPDRVRLPATAPPRARAARRARPSLPDRSASQAAGSCRRPSSAAAQAPVCRRAPAQAPNAACSAPALGLTGCWRGHMRASPATSATRLPTPSAMSPTWLLDSAG